MDPSRLAPEDAYYANSPPRRQRDRSETTGAQILGVDGVVPDSVLIRQRREKEGRRSGSRKRKGAWKKLLWVRQSCTVHTMCSMEALDDDDDG
jgi:phosphatidylinositol glycan class C protein